MAQSTFPIARVVVELPVPSPLDYEIPPDFRLQCQTGQRVLVPLGNRHVLGYIVDIIESSPVPDLKALLEVIDDTPLLTPELLRLTGWVADYYMCPWGQVLKTAIPAGFRVQTTTIYALTPTAAQHPQNWPVGNAGEILQHLAVHGAQTRDELTQVLGNTNLYPPLRRLHKAGLIRSEHRQRPPKTGQRLVAMVRLCLTPDEAETLQRTLQRRAPNQAAILSLLQQHTTLELAALRGHVPGARAAVNRLQQRAAVELTQVEQLRQVVPSYPPNAYPPPELNTLQQDALHHIHDKLNTPDGQPVLLHGVTGSGKTEVYMSAITTILRHDKTALVLVPEISLTGQLVERFAARFQSHVAVLHSGLSDGERFDEWRRLARGDARIAIGARSAVFAPLPQLGLIIVDEEHDTSYKQEETPRYNARDVAIVRAQQSGAIVVLGSATPSLETFQHTQTGKYALLSLPHRVEAKPLPHVTIVDHRAHAMPTERVITTPLYEAIAARIERREQCLVLMNRRGFASYIQCHDCGEVPQCLHCSVSLTFHRHTRTLKCHYCDFSQPAPSTCQSCQSTKLQPFGIGTQQVADVLKTLFPTVRLDRMDRDTTRRKAAHQHILHSLRQGALDILVGTQMIAKGHDFPNITLVGVVAADATLSIPDFRAPERLFQLLTQVSGRAGRGEVPGEVIIQTYRPDHYSVLFAEHHDFLGFFQDEIERRRGMLYPPYTRLARLILEGTMLDRVTTASHWITEVLQRHIADCSRQTVLGPAEAPIMRMHNRYRWHFLLKAASSRSLHQWLSATLAYAENHRQHLSGVRLSVDIDPMTFI